MYDQKVIEMSIAFRQETGVLLAAAQRQARSEVVGALQQMAALLEDQGIVLRPDRDAFFVEVDLLHLQKNLAEAIGLATAADTDMEALMMHVEALAALLGLRSTVSY